jgi:hypothetical protein
MTSRSTDAEAYAANTEAHNGVEHSVPTGTAADAGREACASDCTRVQNELAYYTQQVAHWQDSLGHLGEGPNAVGSARALMMLDAPQSG